jgi:hypothetical protein
MELTFFYLYLHRGLTVILLILFLKDGVFFVVDIFLPTVLLFIALC